MSLRRLPFQLIVPCATALLFAAGCAQRQPQAEMIAPQPRPQVKQPATVWVPPAPPVAPQPPPAKPRPPVTPPPSASRALPREWTPSVASRSWKWIVVHHSATPVGGAARFNKEHVAKGWDELGYHFVIGNGTDTPDGSIEVGSRWHKQKQGAHCKTPDNRFNDYGIGICLVGHFDQVRPSDAQLRSLARLVSALQKGYRISAAGIIGHGDAKATECPGRNLQISTVRRLSAQALADTGDEVPDAPTASAQLGHELLFDPTARR